MQARLVLIVASVLLGMTLAAPSVTRVAGAQQARSGSHAAGHAYDGTHRLYGSRCAHSPRPKGTLTFSDSQFPPNLNIYTGGNSAVMVEQTTLTVDTLWLYNNHARLIPDLAAQIPSVGNGGISRDSRTYVIHLKPGLRWSNGQPIDAADVAFSWQVNMQKATGPYCAASCNVIADAGVLNKLTVAFHLKRPMGSAVANAFMFPIWPHVWKNAWPSGNVAAATKKLTSLNYTFEGPGYPTSGPYQVVQFIPHSRIVYRPNKYYRTMNCGASVKRLVFTAYPSKTALITAAARRRTDVTDNYTNADILSIQSNAAAYHFVALPTLGPQVFTFNDDLTFDGRANPVHNAAVRQALALATNRYAVAAALEGSPALGRRFVAWNFITNTKSVTAPFADRKIRGVWDPITKKFTTTPGKGKALADAKKLLSHTRWKGGLILTGITTCNNAARASAFKVARKDWARIGVRLNWHCSGSIFDSYSENGDMAHGRFQVSLHGYSGGSPDPDAWRGDLSYQFCPRVPGHTAKPGDQAFECIDDPVLQRAWQTESRTANGTVRRRAFQTLQTRMAKLGYWQPISYDPIISTWDRHVGNFHQSPLGPIDWNAYDWKFVK